MSNRPIILLGLAVMLAALAGCQGQPEPAPAATQPPAAATQAPAATEAAIATPPPTEAATSAPTEAATTSPAAAGTIECAWAGSGATAALGDKRFNFDCGKDGDFIIGLFGDVTIGDKGWEITRAEVNPSTTPMASQKEQTVLVTHIILDDGTDCAFAGVGATTGIGDKRLNYTCGQDGDYTIGLFGDIMLGDKGWQMTKGEVKVTTNGPVSQNVTTVTIAKLGVEPE